MKTLVAAHAVTNDERLGAVLRLFGKLMTSMNRCGFEFYWEEKLSFGQRYSFLSVAHGVPNSAVVLGMTDSGTIEIVPGILRLSIKWVLEDSGVDATLAENYSKIFGACWLDLAVQQGFILCAKTVSEPEKLTLKVL